MKKTLSFVIGKDDAGMPLRNYLRKAGLSHGLVATLKNHDDGIIVNGKRTFTDYLLQENDELVLNVSERKVNSRIQPYDYSLDIRYEDEDLMIINKPAGMPVHPSRMNNTTTLANAIASYFMQKGLDPVFHCINRLDKDTSGLTVVAKNMYMAALLSEIVKERKMHRQYLAIVSDKMTVTSGTIDAGISKAGRSMIRIIDDVNGEHAVTHYSVISSNDEVSLVQLVLETGRTHQIRVHMKYLGHPLLGDVLYNPDDNRMTRTALHAQRVSFIHPISHEEIDISAELPEDMKTVAEKYGLL